MANTITVRKLNKLEDGITIVPMNLTHELIFNSEGYLAGIVANNLERGYSYGQPESPNHKLVEKQYPGYKITRAWEADGVVIDNWNQTLWNT